MKKVFEKTKYTKYYITDKGDVFVSSKYNSDGTLRKRKLSPHKSRKYVYIRTAKRNYQVHRLVASYFIRKPRKNEEVNHKDGDKTNNNVSNLEWVSHKHNILHAQKNGLSNLLKKNEGNIKYTNEQCKGVIERVRQGMTYIQAGRIFGMPYSTVAHLIRGSRRKI